jgi:hypothetical protein
MKRRKESRVPNQTKFEQFLGNFGVENLSRELEITNSAICHWLSGRTSPRPERAHKILMLAKRRRFVLSLDEIYQHSRAIRSGPRYRTASLKPQPARV